MRVVDAAGLERFVNDARASGRRIVFTNGVFDLLHPGHVRYLQAARGHGDLLIVGLNSDASVRRNKGPERPINPEQERAEVLAALTCVDAVSIFDADTPADIIRRVQPDILVKGADWPADQIVGRDTVEARGGKVILEPVEQGYSTSTIIEKLDVPETADGSGTKITKVTKITKTAVVFFVSFVGFVNFVPLPSAVSVV